MASYLGHVSAPSAYWCFVCGSGSDGGGGVCCRRAGKGVGGWGVWGWGWGGVVEGGIR